MVWSANTRTVRIVLPNGRTVEVEEEKPFVTTVQTVARGAGLTKFDVYTDGEKVAVSSAPSDFTGITEVKLKKYDEGA